MARTAIENDRPPPDPEGGCWRCGDRTVRGSVLQLGEHPEVGVCFRCVGVLAKRKREIERRTRSAPAGLPRWRRVLYRAGYNRC